MILSYPAAHANVGAVQNGIVISLVVGTAGGALQIIMVFVLCVIYPKRKNSILKNETQESLASPLACEGMNDGSSLQDQ